jgi:hypothetical protein
VPPIANGSAIVNGSTGEAGGIETGVDGLLGRLHFTRVDGRVCFAGSTNGKANFRLPAEAAGDADLKVLARRAAGRDGKPATSFKGAPKPATTYHSEAGRRSLLRTDWSAAGAQLAVDWSRPDLRLEFAIGREVIFAGTTAPDVTIDGSVQKPVGSWSEVVWLSDVDADYLELEIGLSGGARLQRQFLLTRRDGWLYVADVLLMDDMPVTDSGPGGAAKAGRDAEVRLTLPNVEKSRFTPADETCEGMLGVGRRQLAVVPAGLSEWRSANRSGSLAADGGELSLRMSGTQIRALYVPLAIQFHASRVRRPLTWRRLTVGENLEIVASDRAVGFRLQFGREHWLVYRSLTPRANRTVLGVNLQTDFLFSRFTTEGESELLMEIEA